MPTAHQLRAKIEAQLAHRIPSALTPSPHLCSGTINTGITEVDELLGGGLPLGGITEVYGPQSSGRTSLAMSLAASVTRSGNVCAWIDAGDEFDTVSAAAAGVILPKLLLVRCGRSSGEGDISHALSNSPSRQLPPWKAIDKAIRSGDILLQNGGFQAVILDLAGFSAELISRIPLSTWFRFRSLTESQSCCLLLLTQHFCTKSSASLSLQLFSPTMMDEGRVMTGVTYNLHIHRQRFEEQAPTPIRKPPQRSQQTEWRSRSTWTGS